MTRLDPSAEPAREAAYRRLHERISTQDSCISWLLVELRALQKRVTKLEQRNDNLADQAMSDDPVPIEYQRMKAEIERLTLENWQLKGALGYEVPGDIPPGDFTCGLCDAKHNELLLVTRRGIEQRQEIEKLRADAGELLALFRDHYWDSLQKDRDIILLHVEAVLASSALELKP